MLVQSYRPTRSQGVGDGAGTGEARRGCWRRESGRRMVNREGAMALGGGLDATEYQ